MQTGLITAAGRQFFPAQDWVFIHEDNLLVRFGYATGSMIGAFAAAPNMFTPVRKRGIKSSLKPPQLTELGAGLHLTSPEIMEMLSLHQRRLKTRALLSVAVMMLVIGLVALVIIALTGLGVLAFGVHDAELVMLLMAYCSLILLPWVFFRLITLLVDKRFADSLALMSWVYITASLSRDSTLGDPNQRRRVLRYMEDLQRSVRLLVLTHGSSRNQNRQWLQKHFGKLANYIADRERWAIAPQESTLETLREDFWALAPIFIEGNYGAFAWPDDAADVEETPEERKSGIAAQVARMVGFGLPLVVLGVLLMKPSWMASLGLNAQTLALIFFSWLLLAIDGIFKLGVISGLISLAKGVKELT